MKLTQMLTAGVLLVALAACGPPDVDTAVNEAIATATAILPPGTDTTVEALATDPTVAALAAEVEATAAALMAEADAALADPTVQASLDEAFQSLNDRVTVTRGEAITFDALAGLSDITNYRMTVVDAPAGAEASEGKVIKEASDGNVTLDPSDYEQYFTVAGDYKVRLDIISDGNKTATHEFTITVP